MTRTIGIEIRSLFVVAASAVLLAGCGRKEPAAAPAPAAPAPAPIAVSDPNAAARAAAEAAAAAQREEQRIRAALQERVFFDYDDSEIRSDSRQALDLKAQVLREAPSVRLRIEGHADERGSTEYNLALGSRRASSVLNYLTGFGISASRFEIVSYGEERPLTQGGGESAWAQNRRAEFVITAGMETN